MENREAKRSRKRSKTAAVGTKPEVDDSNPQLVESKQNKRKKKQAAIKDFEPQDEVIPDSVEETKEKTNPEPNSVSNTEDGAEGPPHGFCVVPSAKRLLLLHSFLKKNLSKKVVVICSSWQSAKFYTDLFKQLKIDSAYFYGKRDQEKGRVASSKFNEEDGGILFTDIPVADLQVSDVDWIVQYDPPDLPQDYTSTEGKILTFLTPEELQYVNHLKDAKVRTVEYKFENNKLSKGEPQLEKLVSKNHYLHTSAIKAYRSYMLAYDQRSMKDVFNVDRLDVLAVATSFCISNPPKITPK
uniref:ATP-dependent RNA helicase n=1 Tax=Kalanchoe fedtschenkoi TaxID=63787 RepID=A0A7N0V3T4_KALFE